MDTVLDGTAGRLGNHGSTSVPIRNPRLPWRYCRIDNYLVRDDNLVVTLIVDRDTKREQNSKCRITWRCTEAVRIWNGEISVAAR